MEECTQMQVGGGRKWLIFHPGQSKLTRIGGKRNRRVGGVILREIYTYSVKELRVRYLSHFSSLKIQNSGSKLRVQQGKKFGHRAALVNCKTLFTLSSSTTLLLI